MDRNHDGNVQLRKKFQLAAPSEKDPKAGAVLRTEVDTRRFKYMHKGPRSNDESVPIRTQRISSSMRTSVKMVFNLKKPPEKRTITARLRASSAAMHWWTASWASDGPFSPAPDWRPQPTGADL